jgi:hypothetical protein
MWNERYDDELRQQLNVAMMTAGTGIAKFDISFTGMHDDHPFRLNVVSIESNGGRKEPKRVYSPPPEVLVPMD